MAKNYCLCCSDEIGTKIIGWLDLIFSIILFCFFTWGLSLIEDDSYVFWISIVSLVAFGGRSIMAAVLLVGIYKPKPDLIICWVLYSALMLAFVLVVLGIYLGMGEIFFYPGVTALILMYAINVVINYHIQLTNETASFVRMQEA